MSTVLVLVALGVVFVLLRHVTEERITCNSCLKVVRKRRMTTLADGRLICMECLNKVISSGMQNAVAKLPGAKEQGAFALEPGDTRIGNRCPVCGFELKALDAVCGTDQRLSHLSCAQVAHHVAMGAEIDKPRILVAEGEEPIRNIVISMLTSAGFDCQEAVSGRDATDLLGTERIDLVLSNLLMADVDGWSLFLHVKKHYPHIPFVFLTPVTDLSVREAAAKEGASAFLLMPCSREDLLLTVRTALRRPAPTPT